MHPPQDVTRAAERSGLDPAGAVAAAYEPELQETLRSVRREAEAAGVAGVPSLLAEDGRGMAYLIG